MTTVIVWVLSLLMVCLAVFLLLCVARLAWYSLRTAPNQDSERDK